MQLVVCCYLLCFRDGRIKLGLTEIGGEVEKKDSFLDLLFEVLNISIKHKMKKGQRQSWGVHWMIEVS